MCVKVLNIYKTTMSWLRQGITVVWTVLPYCMYKKCFSAFYCDRQS